MAVANGGFLTDETEVMDRRVLVENEWNQGRASEQRAETSHSLFEEDDIRNGKKVDPNVIFFDWGSLSRRRSRAGGTANSLCKY
ncbi:hypothetical protein WR25_07409 [Diploscapter pachys]|uniref:Uncharacterized protein n=1 Tax=Diploscapter pachys TaxID=2018661 RepID=A0A2A2KR18_9BILA|nr:hypothetical protein WR25_07409 [Diploscapter pachys]